MDQLFSLTETVREIPCFSIVIPYRTSASSIVRLLCVTRRYWYRCDISRTKALNRDTEDAQAEMEQEQQKVLGRRLEDAERIRGDHIGREPGLELVLAAVEPVEEHHLGDPAVAEPGDDPTEPAGVARHHQRPPGELQLRRLLHRREELVQRGPRGPLAVPR